ncbi:MAG: hypothetical protein U5Q03_05620 [Bacteroidota bacterium]|nr:hypothetical protein [Bacteroidota bacterium]
MYQKIDEAKLGDEPVRLFEIDPLQYNNQGYEAVEIDLNNTCIYPDLDYNPDASGFYYNFTTPFIDPEENKIYLPNGGHSNISVVDFDPADILEIENDITWLSFPRLDRPGNTTVSVDDALLDMINPTYDNESKLEYFDGSYVHSVYDFYQHTWRPDPPTGGLPNVRSDLGYVLDLEYGSSPDLVLLHMRGTQLDPNNPPYIQLTDQYQTWAGYWLEESQYPLDAIPEDDLLYMYRIEGQYWTCQREPLPDNAQPPYYQYPFVCSENRGVVELNYGDMVKVFASADLSFTWLSNTGGDGGIERLATENFSYVEQTDYTHCTWNWILRTIPRRSGLLLEIVA